MPFSEPSPPDNVVVVLLDSLNRHMLGATAARVRDAEPRPRSPRPQCASRTTTPARCRACRRVTTSCAAQLDFLWKPWGSIELWEEPITVRDCAEAGVVTKLISDHPHLFETGGENYHVDFTAWDYERGHERRPVEDAPRPELDRRAELSAAATCPTTTRAAGSAARSDFPGPRTMAAAARWLDDERRMHDRFLLFVDEFDPHEPFDTPEPYASHVRPRRGRDRT